MGSSDFRQAFFSSFFEIYFAWGYEVVQTLPHFIQSGLDTLGLRGNLTRNAEKVEDGIPRKARNPLLFVSPGGCV